MFQQSTPPPGHIKPVQPKKEKSGWGGYAGWLFIALGIAAIIWMIATHYRQPRLICNGSARGPNSLIQMGSCTEE